LGKSRWFVFEHDPTCYFGTFSTGTELNCSSGGSEEPSD
jgi:hypothetical protein